MAVVLLSVAPLGGAGAKPLEFSVRPLPLSYTAPEQTRVGRLIWRGGLDISSPSIRFGGFSGLLVSPDGARLTAINDDGYWMTATLTYDANGNLTGIADGDIARLRDEDGRNLARGTDETGKTDQDAEAMTQTSDGSILLAFERNHRIWGYAAGAAPLRDKAELVPGPDGLADLAKNRGMEALVTLADDSILAIVEGEDEDLETPAFLRRDGVWSRLRYQRFGDYRPSDAARLPGGDVLVLERRFTVLEGVGIRVVRIPASAIVPGALLQPVEIARLLPPLSIDNMEGLAVRRNARGETLIYMISDDNFNVFQRTLLLLFALEE